MTPGSFSDDPTRIAHVIVLSVFSFFALLAVILRLWARKIQRMRLDLSDYLIIAALVWTLAESIFTMYSIIYWDLGGNLTQYGNPDSILKMVIIQLKAGMIGILVWGVAVFLIRASILVLYIRIFRTKSFRITCYVVHGINFAFFVSTILRSVFICRPFAYIWDKTIPGGRCGDQKSLDLYLGIFNLFLDVCLVVLPMPVLWGLQMAVSKKLMLSSMFGLGIIICAITIDRIRRTIQNIGTNSMQVYSLVALLACLEALLGVLNACLPVLKPIFTKVIASKLSKWLSSVMSGSIPVFMRPSQMGTNYTSRNSMRRHSSGAKRDSGQRKLMPMRKWPGSPDSKSPPHTVIPISSPAPPRYVDNKPAMMMFSPTYTSASASSDPGMESPPPPVPPKGLFDRHRTRWEPIVGGRGAEKGGIWVQKEWNTDVERADSAETERELLKRENEERGF